MDQVLIDHLNQRGTVLTERQRCLMKEYEELEKELHHIAALLEMYSPASTGISPLVSPSVPSFQVSSQESTSSLGQHSVNAENVNKIKTRRSPGETEKYVDTILDKGESHSVVSLVRRIEEELGIKLSDSTIGVVLKHGEKTGKYKRDGYQWSMVSSKNHELQRLEDTSIDNDAIESIAKD